MGIILAKNNSGSSISFKSGINGRVLYFNSALSKWISVNRFSHSFDISHRNVIHEQWLRYNGIPSNTHSASLIDNAVIVGMSVRTQNQATCDFEISKNNDTTLLYTLSLGNQYENSVNTLNLDVLKGDFLQVKVANITGNVDYPSIYIELAYRE